MNEIDPEGDAAKSAYSRPSFTAAEKEIVWQNAVRASRDGIVRDPLTHDPIDKSLPWDVGHLPGYENKKMGPAARLLGLTPEQVKSVVKTDLTIYRPETINTNRGRRLHDPDSVNKWNAWFKSFKQFWGLDPAESEGKPESKVDKANDKKAEDAFFHGQLDPNDSPGVQEGKSDEQDNSESPGATVDGHKLEKGP